MDQEDAELERLPEEEFTELDILEREDLQEWAIEEPRVSSSTGSLDIADLIRQIVVGLLGVYVILKILEIVFNISVPLV